MHKRILALVVALCALLVVPSPRASAAGADTYSIGVDITNQITTVYRRSDDSVVRQMICSTGKGVDWTPLGVFNLEKSRESTDRQPWYYISAYRCFVKYATRIKGPILFHSLPYAERDMASIDEEALRELGTRASHGCIRLRWQDAEWIAKNCPDGTEVTIYKGVATKEALRQALLEAGYSADSGLTYRQFLKARGLDGDDTGLAPGDSGEEVAALQRRLIGLGFFSGAEPTGRYDNATVAAVTRYQSAANLVSTGIASRALIRRIMAETTLSAEYSTLTPGCAGTLVTAVQQTLRDVGFYSGDIDGVYGDELRDAVHTACGALDIEPTDRLTPSLRAELYALLRRLIRLYGRDNFSMAQVDGTARWGVAAGALGESVMDADSVGPGVAALKERLRALGFFDGEVNEIYDADTVSAVKDCQAAAGLWPNGRATVSLQRRIVESDDITGCRVALRLGLQSPAVAALQEALRALGFYGGTADGRYDAATAVAVRRFAKAEGLEATVDASPGLQRIIFERAQNSSGD